MKKHQQFPNTRFTSETLKSAFQTIQSIAEASQQTLEILNLDIEHDDARWSYDSPDEFYADYRRYDNSAHIHAWGGRFGITVWAWARSVDVVVSAISRSEIERVFAIFEASKAACQLPVEPNQRIEPVVFIGHGRSGQWRDMKDHLQEKHGYRVEAYETGARAGHTIRDVLEDLIQKSSFAVLVLTAEDEQADGQYRARQNVIHEAGLFQGRLGFKRAIVLLEEGVEEFSNLAGIQYIPFSRNNIKETFGDVLATLRREFDASTGGVVAVRGTASC